jgi:hypothetical protein
MSLLSVPDGIESFLISSARAVMQWGYQVSQTSGQAFPPGYLGSAVEGTFPSDLLSFLIPHARNLNRFGWDVTD